jgi:hypothetical protein
MSSEKEKDTNVYVATVRAVLDLPASEAVEAPIIPVLAALIMYHF